MTVPPHIPTAPAIPSLTPWDWYAGIALTVLAPSFVLGSRDVRTESLVNEARRLADQMMRHRPR